MRTGNLKVAIVDDEAPARARLSAMVSDLGGWDIVAEAANGNEALEKCRESHPDVVLLDIRMPGLDGMEVAKQLAELKPAPSVVFTTAYDEYAISAFDAEAIAYLLKPVRRERLLKALSRAVKSKRLRTADWQQNNPEEGPRQSISVSSRGAISIIDMDDVVSFHADQKYVRVVHAQGEALLDESLKQLEEEFADHFVRIHRNSLVRLSQISQCLPDENGRLCVEMRGNRHRYPVSRRHAAQLKRLLREAH